EENYIPLETQSQGNKPVTPSEPEGSKGKRKRHSKGLFTAKKWTTIATQRSRKPQNSASIQGKPALTTFTGKITIINPVVTSKVKVPKSADNKFVQGTVKEILASKGTNKRKEKACPEPEDLEEDTLDTVVDEKTLRKIIPSLVFTFQFSRNLKTEDSKDMDQVLQLHQLLKDLFQWSMANKRFNLACHWAGLGESFQKICLKEIDFKDLMVITKDQWPRVTTLHNPRKFLEKKRIQGQKQDHLQQEEDRVRPNDPEAVGFGERSAQEPEVVVHNSRISRPLNRNITPTEIEHNVAEKSKKQFEELQASHERMKELTASMDKIVKNLQEGHAQLNKASKETNKRLNLVFEGQQHIKRDKDCLDQDINKLFNVYHSMKPQPQGHVMDNPYHQDDIKPDAMLMNKARSPSQYKDGDNISYSEKEALQQLLEASSWPKYFVIREYDHMELIDYIDGLFLDVPSIPDYWITARLNTAFKQHASGGVKRKTQRKGGRSGKKKDSCPNCGSTDHYANNCPKAKKKVYAIEKVPEEESPTEVSESDSIVEAIREHSDDDQDPREEFLV
ncbi:hypothetical protein O181_063985, partial [Austropuccinia psidii MF-1]|nr:hypothetical protein [Austropuccinia psidii MF-1]